MNNARLKAFTMLEITVTMAIAAIVITIIYTAYGIVSRSFASFRKNQEQVLEFVQLDKMIKRDFNRAGIIYLDSSRLVFMEGMLNVRYAFNDSSVIRTGGTIDTFKVVNKNVQFNFEHHPATEGAWLAEKNKVDELLFDVSFKDNIIHYIYRKHYSAEDFLKDSTYAIH